MKTVLQLLIENLEEIKKEFNTKWDGVESYWHTVTKTIHI